MENKLYYTIGEVAEMLQTTSSQLRYWSGEFDLNVRKNRKGDRLFQKVDLDKLRFIQKLLKDEGYTIEGAKKRLKNISKAKLTQIADELPSNARSIEEAPNSQMSSLINDLKSIKGKLEILKNDLDNA